MSCQYRRSYTANISGSKKNIEKRICITYTFIFLNKNYFQISAGEAIEIINSCFFYYAVKSFMMVTYDSFQGLCKLDKINLLEVEGERMYDFKNEYQSTEFFKLFNFFVVVSYNQHTGRLINIDGIEMIEQHPAFNR